MTETYLLLILLGGGVLLLLAVLIAWLRSRRSQKLEPEEEELLELAQSYQARYPLFSSILESISEEKLAPELEKRGDVRAALRLLEERAPRQKAQKGKRKDRKGSLLDLPPPSDRRVQAAITTVLRAIYMEEALLRILSQEQEEELDRFVDSLTA